MYQERSDDALHFFSTFIPDGVISVLELGAGEGKIAAGIAQLYPYNDFVVSDVNISQVADEVHRLDNVVAVRSDVINLPFKDESFDYVYMHCVNMYIESISSVYAEIMRVIKPGGVLALRDAVFVFNNMEEFVGNNKGLGFLSELMLRNGDDPKRALNVKEELLKLGADRLSFKTKIDKFTDADSLSKIASHFSTIMKNMDISQCESFNSGEFTISDLESDIYAWSASSSSYNKTIWVEQVFKK